MVIPNRTTRKFVVEVEIVDELLNVDAMEAATQFLDAISFGLSALDGPKWLWSIDDCEPDDEWKTEYYRKRFNQPLVSDSDSATS